MNRFQHHCSRLLSFGSLLGVLAIACAAQAQTCPVYPIALSGQMLSNVPVNTVVMDVQPGNFSWLSWAGDLSEPTLVTSLTAPGDSTNYVNPDDLADHEIDVDDWITAKPGSSNSIGVRDALDNLAELDSIIVPVFDDVRDTGDTIAYHVSGFVQVRIVGHRQNKITLLFLGFTGCSGGDGGPGV
jgi:hypothetical protein